MSRTALFAWGVKGGCLMFTALACAAMAVYPGGTAWNHDAPGNDFWLNYLCDLARTVARNGQPNLLGSVLARVAMLSLATALGPFYWLLAQQLQERRARDWLLRLAGVSLIGTCLTVLLPVNQFPRAHEGALVAAAVPGLLACGCALLFARCRVRASVAFRLGILTLCVATIDFALYARHELLPGPGPMAIAVLERASALLLLAWMWASARSVQLTDSIGSSGVDG